MYFKVSEFPFLPPEVYYLIINPNNYYIKYLKYFPYVTQIFKTKLFVLLWKKVDQ